MIPKQMKNQSVDLYRKMQGITHIICAEVEVEMNAACLTGFTAVL